MGSNLHTVIFTDAEHTTGVPIPHRSAGMVHVLHKGARTLRVIADIHNDHKTEEVAMAFITVQETADRLSVSRATLDRLVARGEFPQPFQFSDRALRFDSHDVEEWIAAQRRTNNQPKEATQ